ncbi:MAG: hypothetical protein LUH03_09810 [Oscillospiraceae bacterium]|nr:hypothetical protein [Oscillospiraceae bacterium]
MVVGIILAVIAVWLMWYSNNKLLNHICIVLATMEAMMATQLKKQEKEGKQ